MQVTCTGYIHCMLITIKLYFSNINEKFYGIIYIEIFFVHIHVY